MVYFSSVSVVSGVQCGIPFPWDDASQDELVAFYRHHVYTVSDILCVLLFRHHMVTSRRSVHRIIKGCTADSRNLKLLENYPWMAGVTFIKFLTSLFHRRIWYNLLRRGGPNDRMTVQNIGKWQRVCSQHIVDGCITRCITILIPNCRHWDQPLYSYPPIKSLQGPRGNPVFE